MKFSRASASFILVTVLIEAVSRGLTIPVIPGLITKLLGPHNPNASLIYSALVALDPLTGFFFVPIMGALSDRFGRRSVILMGLSGAILIKLVLATAGSLWMLFVAQFISGAFGALAISARAYTADTLEPGLRAKAFAHIAAASAAGALIGPTLGGVLGDIHLRLPFFAAAILTSLDLLYGIFVMPESLAPEARRPLVLRKLYVTAFSALPWMLSRSVGFRQIVAGVLISDFAGGMAQAVWIFFLTRQIGWTAAQIGFSLAVAGACMLLVQGLIAQFVIRGLGDRACIFLGLTLRATGLVILGFATHSWEVYAAIVIGALAGIAQPVVQASLANEVQSSEQGRLQGSLFSVGVPFLVLAPLLGGWLYGLATSANGSGAVPGVVYFFAAALLVPACILLIRGAAPREPHQPISERYTPSTFHAK
jgi:DHA1 family tetracycline resistance protein-like MFS transporter